MVVLVSLLTLERALWFEIFEKIPVHVDAKKAFLLKILLLKN